MTAAREVSAKEAFELKQNGKRNGGYSLIEVVISIAIIGLLSAGAFASFSASIRMNARTQALMEAELRLKTAIEIVRAEGIDENNVTGNNLNQGKYPDLPGNVDIKVSTYAENQRYYTATFSTAVSEGESKEVTVLIRDVTESAES